MKSLQLALVIILMNFSIVGYANNKQKPTEEEINALRFWQIPNDSYFAFHSELLIPLSSGHFYIQNNEVVYDYYELSEAPFCKFRIKESGSNRIVRIGRKARVWGTRSRGGEIAYAGSPRHLQGLDLNSNNDTTFSRISCFTAVNEVESLTIGDARRILSAFITIEYNSDLIDALPL